MAYATGMLTELADAGVMLGPRWTATRSSATRRLRPWVTREVRDTDPTPFKYSISNLLCGSRRASPHSFVLPVLQVSVSYDRVTSFFSLASSSLLPGG